MNLNFYKQIQKELLETSQKAQLIAVTKYSNINEINEAIKQGITKIGENRIESMEEKMEYLLPVEKHFIGVVQGKKLKRILNNFDIIQSIAKWEHLEKLNKIALEEGKIAKIFLQVNISHEYQKSGFTPSDLKNIKEKIILFKNITVQGIMGMAENTENKDDIRMQFRLARNIFNDLKKEIPTIKELSLGMSSDYKIALEEGATLVRIGSALFK